MSPLQDPNCWHISAPARRLESSMKSNALESFELEIDWTAQTILPIEFNGRELHMEARAYQGTDPAFQALVLVHRGQEPGRGEARAENGRGESGGIPGVRVHSGCV